MLVGPALGEPVSRDPRQLRLHSQGSMTRGAALCIERGNVIVISLS